MINHLLHVYGFNETYAKMLVSDLSEEQMTAQPREGMNHPAWVVGHLAMASGLVVKLAGGEPPESPEGWGELFGMKSKPLAEGGKYPDKVTLVAALETSHAAVSELLPQVDAALLGRAMPSEGLGSVMPTVGDAITFMITSHESIHLGQLSAWRRAMGLPSVF